MNHHFFPSSTSTTSSDQHSPHHNHHHSGGSSDFSKADYENRLREHISSLKTIRASIQNSIVELEPLHNDPDVSRLEMGQNYDSMTQRFELID